MKHFLIALLLLAGFTSAALAGDSNRFVGIWAAGGVQREGPALFLFPNGKAYFHAMCGKAAGTWRALDSPEQIEVQLREESTGPFDSFTLQLDSRGWLIRKQSVATTNESPAPIASDVLKELEKSEHELPKIK